MHSQREKAEEEEARGILANLQQEMHNIANGESLSIYVEDSLCLA